MSIKSRKNQLGITLITSLMMLLVMTIISITAMKVSTVDMIIANNFQQQLSVYQEAQTKTSREVNFYRLYDWINESKQPPDTTKDRILSKAEVTDLKRDYPCKGHGSLANSLGPDAPVCKMFMFAIEADLKGTGANESHYQGAGKQFPNQSKGSYY